MTAAEAELELLAIEEEDAAEAAHAAPAPKKAKEYSLGPVTVGQRAGPLETFLNKTADALPLGRLGVNGASALMQQALRLGGHGQQSARLTPQAMEELRAGAGDMGAGERASLLAGPKDALPGLVQGYRDARQTYGERTAAGEADNPWAGRFGTGVGTALSLLAPLPKATVGSGAGGRIASNALTGGGYGVLNGAINGNADVSRGEIGQLLQDMASGGVVGALTGGVLGGAVELGRMGAGALKSFANRKALNALGAMKPELNDLGTKRAQELGEHALEQGVVSPFASRKTMAARAAEGKTAAGEKLNNALADVDAVALPQERAGLTSEAAAKQIDQLANEIGRKPALRAVAEKFRQEAAAIRGSADAGQSPGGLSLQQYEELIARPYKGVTNWAADLRLPKETLKQLPRKLEANAEDAIEQVAGRTGDKGPLSRYVTGKRQYGNQAELAEIAEEGLKRQGSNGTLSLKDLHAVTPGVLLGSMSHGGMGGAVGGAATLLGSKVLNRFGDQWSATGANALARALSSGSAGMAGQRAALLERALFERPSLMPAAGLSEADRSKLEQWANALRKDGSP